MPASREGVRWAAGCDFPELYEVSYYFMCFHTYLYIYTLFITFIIKHLSSHPQVSNILLPYAG